MGNPHKAQPGESFISQIDKFVLIIVPLLILIPRSKLPGGGNTTPNHLASQELAHSLAASILAIIGLVRLLRNKEPIKLSQNLVLLIVSLAAFCAWQLISLFWSPDPAEGFRVVSIGICFGIFFISGLTRLDTNSLRQFYLALTTAMILLALYQLFLYAQYGAELKGVLYSFYLKTELLALLIPLQLAVFLQTKNKLITALSFTSVVTAWLVEMQLIKRGPLLGLMLSFLIIGIALAFKLINADSSKRLATIAGAIILIAGTQILLQTTTVKSTYQSTGYSLNFRLETASIAGEIIKRNFLVGTGAGSYNVDYAIYRRFLFENPKLSKLIPPNADTSVTEARSTNVHNEFLQIMAETGLMGTLLFITFWLLIIWTLWKQLKLPENYLAIGAFGGLIAYAVCSAITSYSFRASPGALLVACILIIALRHHFSNLTGNLSSFSIPKPLLVIGLIVVTLLSTAFTVRSFSVMRSYEIEADLDFYYEPQVAEKNEAFLKEYQNVFAWDPYNSAGHLGCGLLLYQMKRSQEAIPHLEYATRHGFSRPWAVSLLAFCYEQTGQLDKAIKSMEDCLAAFPYSTYSRAVYAEMLRKNGAIDLARQQKNLVTGEKEKEVRSWEIALSRKPEEAMTEMKNQGLPGFDELHFGVFRLEEIMVQVRSYHYLP